MTVREDRTWTGYVTAVLLVELAVVSAVVVGHAERHSPVSVAGMVIALGLLWFALFLHGRWGFWYAVYSQGEDA